MTAQQREHIDTFYRTFHRTPFTEVMCEYCKMPVFRVKDDLGTWHTLDNRQSCYVQIRDSDTNEQTVSQISGFVDHAFLCGHAKEAA